MVSQEIIIEKITLKNTIIIHKEGKEYNKAILFTAEYRIGC